MHVCEKSVFMGQRFGCAHCLAMWTFFLTTERPTSMASEHSAPCPAPSAPAESRSQQHATIARIASAQNGRASQLTNGVSLHTMQQSVSFANLRALLTGAQGMGHGQRIFVGSRDGAIVVSLNFNFEAPSLPRVEHAATSKKRGRDPIEEGVDAAVDRVRRSLKGIENAKISDQMLSTAKAALYTLLSRLRGAAGEEAVESWGLSCKKPVAGALLSTGTMPKLILSIRLTPGVAVPLPALFSCLGIRCTTDGMLTLQEPTSLAAGFNLPLGEAAKAAEQQGQRALTLFATVADDP